MENSERGSSMYKVLDIKDRKMVNSHLARFQPTASEHTFTNLFIWQNTRPISIFTSGQIMAFLHETNEGVSLFGNPTGSIDFDELKESIEKKTQKSFLGAQRITNSVSADTGYLVDADRDNADYVYKRTDLADLEGKRFHAKRNLITQFEANNSYTYEEIDESNVEGVLKFQDRWCEERKCGTSPGLCDEYRAAKTLLENYSDLDAFGALIRINGRIEGYTIGERLNENTAVIHLEKASTAFKGLYQLINQRFAKRHLNDFEFINREQDLGIAGLRKAKESYHPDHIIEKRVIYTDKRSKELILGRHEHRCK